MPQLKTERCSYPIITPSAARGLVEKILWKPEMTWKVSAIDVLAPIRYWTVMRNEVKSKQSPPGEDDHYIVEKHRTQRYTTALRDVSYVIWVDAVVRPGARCGPKAYTEQLVRRLKRGQHTEQPWLGCREYTAQVSLADPSVDKPCASINQEVPGLLLDFDWSDIDHPEPHFFLGKIEGGRLWVPETPLQDMIRSTPCEPLC